MQATITDIDPFDLPEWLGTGDVAWRADEGLQTGHLVRGRLAADLQRVAPSPLLLTAFMRLLAASIQVRGNFYSREGAEAAAGGLVRKLLDRSVNEPGAYVDPAPRSHPEKIAVA